MSQKIVYITRDIERALGVEPSATYHIVANKTPYSSEIQAKYPEYVSLVDYCDNPLNTAGIMKSLEAKKAVEMGSDKDTGIIVFKNSEILENIAVTNSWKILNPKASLAEEIENKITQVSWLGELATKYLPAHEVKLTKDLTWDNKPFILQWAHGHTGGGTILVNSQDQLTKIQQEFPERMSRKTAEVRGPSFTVNVCVDATRILMGNVSYQITGLAPFTDNAFSTVGNDWALAGDILTEGDHATIESMVADIGKRMQESGWKGLFGLDLMHDVELNKIFLIEVNARQPASTTYESQLQEMYREQGIAGCTMMEAHLASLTGHAPSIMPVIVNDGAQVILRITKNLRQLGDKQIEEIQRQGNKIIKYDNLEDNADLVRIQNTRGYLERHNKLNDRGQKIADIIQAK